MSGTWGERTEVEALLVMVCASTDDGRLLTGCTNLIWTVVDCVASGSGPCIKDTLKCQPNLVCGFGF